MWVHAQSFSSCLCTDLLFKQRLSSESHLTGGLCRLFSVAPSDASRVETLRRHGVCYDDLLVRADHPTVPRHRYGGQHVVALQRERLGTRLWVMWRQEKYWGRWWRPSANLPVTINVRMLACRNCSKTPAVSGFILFCMMIKPRKSMLVSITSLKTQ